jgi:hypothetical protein
VFDGGGCVGAVGIIAAGPVFVGVTIADEPLPAVEVDGVFTVAFAPSPELSLPHAHRSAATPKHVAIRDLMTASNIGNTG